MKDIFVNETREENGITFGYAVLEETVKEDLQIMFKDKGNILKNIEYLKKNSPHPDGFHFNSRFCQYVAMYQFDTKLGSSIKFSDFKNTLDIALDEYLVLSEKGWDEKDRNEIMKIFQEIEKDQKGEKAQLIIKDPLPIV